MDCALLSPTPDNPSPFLNATPRRNIHRSMAPPPFPSSKCWHHGSMPPSSLFALRESRDPGCLPTLGVETDVAAWSLNTLMCKQRTWEIRGSLEVSSGLSASFWQSGKSGYLGCCSATNSYCLPNSVLWSR